MKKILAVIIFFQCLLSTSQTQLYRSLYEGMRKSEFNEALAENQNKYGEIDFGKGVIWEIDKDFCIFEENQLKLVVMKPAGNKNGINYIKTANHLKTSREYLLSKNYVLLNEHELWYSPQRFVDEDYPYAILLQGPNKKVIVKINTERFKGNYMPSISITNANNRKAIEIIEKIYPENGF